LLSGGSRIGPYEVLARLGAGGMGEVYRALDTRLGREVALKVLGDGALGDAGSVAHFQQEARLAGALNHPNVLAVYDVGERDGNPYLVSELLEGESLRERLSAGPLSQTKALSIALQIAQGLEAAHQKGIVHRDLKPENVFLTSGGTVKILDFGIAKLLPTRESTLPGGALLPHTKPGALVGTLAYMSPEQMCGDEVDARADLFSLGCVLYEMLCGRRPFGGKTAMETGAAILHDEPAPLPPDVPRRLSRLVEHCLEKRARDRFQSARDFIFALQDSHPPDGRGWRRATGGIVAGVVVCAAGGLIAYRLAVRPAPLRVSERPGAAERKSIAVLPFVNMSSERDDEYFSDGISEELINALANVQGLQVVSHTSSFAFKGKNLSVRKIGDELNVGAVLEGSIRREGSRLRIAAQLVDVTDGYQLWSATYDRELKNVFAVEEELARSIVHALKPKLLPSDAKPLVKAATTSLEAHDLYLKGQYFWNRRNAETLTKAVASFQQAIEHDPTYALAYVGLADSVAVQLEYGSPALKRLPEAKRAALKALELDGTLAEAHASLGMIHSYNYEWSAAEEELRRATELKPEYPTAHQWYSLLLLSTGRVEKAREEAERARQLDPISLIINLHLSTVLYVGREYDRAVEQARRTLELDPGFPIARWRRATMYIAQGRYADAVTDLEELEASPALRRNQAGLLGYAYAMSGNRAAALRKLAEIEERSMREYTRPSNRALIYMGLGDKDQAFAWLDKAYLERDSRLRELKAYPLFDSLRSDPRFTRLLKQVYPE